jgi:H+/Cl- antiporter ClcA
MTDNHAMIVPLMAAALIGYATSRLVSPHGIYHALSAEFLRTAKAGGAR